MSVVRSAFLFFRIHLARLGAWIRSRVNALRPHVAVARSAVLTFYRSLMRHPLYAALNLLGLSSGIAVLVILSLFVRFETGYDRWLPHAATIYVATAEMPEDTAAGRAPAFAGAGYVLDAIHSLDPSLTGARIIAAPLWVRHNGAWLAEEGEMADGDLFRVFAFRFAAGNPATALSDADGIVVSESMARKYFGRTDVAGRYLDIREGNAAERPRRITAVLRDLPRNSDVRLNIVRRLTAADIAADSQWAAWGQAGRRQTFVTLPGDTQAKALNDRLDGAIADYSQAHFPEQATASRYPGLHVRVAALWRHHLADPKRDQAVTSLDLTGVLVFLVALVNYVNLATARSGQRAREVAMRKILGGNIQALRAQFLIEGLLLSAGALVIGFSLVELTLPVINSMGHLALAIDYGGDAPVLLGLSLGVLACGLLAGTYPAVVLSEFLPVHILSATGAPSAEHYGRWLREGLAALQFATATAFFIVVIGFSSQIQHLEAPPSAPAEAMRPAGSSVSPGQPENASDDQAASRRDVELFAMGAGIAALIAAVGLFGMAAFNTTMRAHEIGIRKSFGASRGRILRQLVFQFLRPVVLGNGLAWPIAWWVLDGWLRQFSDHIAISPTFFIMGTSVSLMIAVLSVAGIAWAAAAAEPGRALRQG